MAGKSNFLEGQMLARMFRRLSTAVGGGNASTTNILVTSSTGFVPGDLIKGTTAGSYHLVTTVPDGTHVTVTPAFGSAPTTGNLECWGYSPAAVYVALFTAAPSDAGGGTECSGGSYARAQVTQADSNWGAPSGTPRSMSNSNAVNFATPSAGWGAVTHYALFDAVSSGNLLYWNTISNGPQTINTGNTVSFASSTITVQED